MSEYQNGRGWGGIGEGCETYPHSSKESLRSHCSERAVVLVVIHYFDKRFKFVSKEAQCASCVHVAGRQQTHEFVDLDCIQAGLLELVAELRHQRVACLIGNLRHDTWELAQSLVPLRPSKGYHFKSDGLRRSNETDGRILYTRNARHGTSTSRNEMRRLLRRDYTALLV